MKKGLLVTFRIEGNLRFLSHQETLTMFHRVLVRAGVDLRYSQGFNPRPKLSLPLPRSVGVQSDNELLFFSLSDKVQAFDTEQITERINTELPCGCEIIDIDITTRGKTSFQPISAEYVFTLTDFADVEKTKDGIEQLRRSIERENPVIVERWAGKNKTRRRIDVGPYIDSIECRALAIVVRCNITNAGSVRVDEILKLLQIDPSMISRPIERRAVQWRDN